MVGRILANGGDAVVSGSFPMLPSICHEWPNSIDGSACTSVRSPTYNVVFNSRRNNLLPVYSRRSGEWDRRPVFIFSPKSDDNSKINIVNVRNKGRKENSSITLLLAPPF